MYGSNVRLFLAYYSFVGLFGTYKYLFKDLFFLR